MRIVKLKKPSEFDFNKTTGHYHFEYDIIKQMLGYRRYQVYRVIDFNHNHKIELKDMKGNIIYSGGEPRMFCNSMFNTVKS